MLDSTPQAGAISEPCTVEHAEQFDFNSDCIVDFEDFAILASSRLSCGIYPDCYQGLFYKSQ
jgi:hypothetical protein